MENSNVTIPLSEVRAKITPFFLNSGALIREGSVYHFDQKVLGTVPGLSTSTTYQNQEQAIDAVLHAWFPNYAQKAA